MKTRLLFLALPFLFLASFIQQPQWTKDQLIQPSELAKILNTPTSVKPVVLNIGTTEQIKTAIKIGAANTDEGIKKLQEQLLSITKDKNIVIYCGCCSSDNCPNIRPAYDLIKRLGYKKVKVLEIPVGLGEDWKSKGYPME